MLNAAIIGFGGIAQAHKQGYEALEAQGKVRLACAYDINPEAAQKTVALNISSGSDTAKGGVNFYTDLEEMLAKEKIDYIDICAPTYKHKELTIQMLRRGFHVLCEKPMSLSSADCEEMIAVAKECGKSLMIGQVLRFYPAFDYLKEVIEDGRYGKILNAHFSRLSTPPTWGWDNWFMDPSRSGGCILDLHVHDVDMVRHLFGEPEAVFCRTSTSICVNDVVHTSFLYGDMPVTAVGDWTQTNVPFTAIAHFGFEKATVVVNLTNVTVYPKDGGEAIKVELDQTLPFAREIGYFVDVISGKVVNTKNPPESAAMTVKLVEKMCESAKTGKVC